MIASHVLTAALEINIRNAEYLLTCHHIHMENTQGKVEVTISQGRVVWENEQLTVEQGSGRYIPMKPFGYLFDGLDKVDATYMASMQAPVNRNF